MKIHGKTATLNIYEQGVFNGPRKNRLIALLPCSEVLADLVQEREKLAQTSEDLPISVSAVNVYSRNAVDPHYLLQADNANRLNIATKVAAQVLVYETEIALGAQR